MYFRRIQVVNPLMFPTKDVGQSISRYLLVSFQKFQKDTKRYQYLSVSFENFQEDTKRYRYLSVSFKKFQKDTGIFRYLSETFEKIPEDTWRYFSVFFGTPGSLV